MRARKIIFAGPARDVAPFVAGVTLNIEAFAGRFTTWAVVIAENDSCDDSKVLLQAWMEKARRLGAAKAVLINMDGLAAQTERTNRIAAARNRILREIAQDAELRQFDYLAMMDMDLPNAYPARPENFAAAAAFLEEHDDVAGVFPNQLPLYYDIWALREKSWCPGDCWDEVTAASPPGDKTAAAKAVAKYVYDRQIHIDPVRAPIEVESAFGGIGLYRLKAILGHEYAGLKPDGTPAADHVALHETIRRDGGRLFILPGFLNVTSFEHTRLGASHILAPLRYGPSQLFLLMAQDSVFQRYPNSGERYAQLASLYARGGGAILDLAPGAGECLVLARLHGCDSEYICVESREYAFAVLSGNALMHGGVFAKHQLLRALPGSTPGLVRLGTGGDASWLLENKMALPPILWARIETAEEADAWEKVLAILPHQEMMAFNVHGARVADGALEEQKPRLLAQFRRLPKSGGGLDLAFFGEGMRDLAQAFRATSA